MSVGLCEIEQVESDLEEWLVEHAEAGVSELVLVNLLRDYAADVEDLGYVPRTWGNSKQ